VLHHRAPDGINHQKFFQRQRHARRFQSWSKLTTVEGDRKPLFADRSHGRPHRHGADRGRRVPPLELRAGSIRRFPAALFFDLDPAPDVVLPRSNDRRKGVAEPVGDLAWLPSARPTGGKGLHVVTPLKVKERNDLGWQEAKGLRPGGVHTMANGQSRKVSHQHVDEAAPAGRIFPHFSVTTACRPPSRPLSPRGAARCTRLDARELEPGAATDSIPRVSRSGLCRHCSPRVMPGGLLRCRGSA